MGAKIKSFIKDIIPVLLGVLLALWINNWNEARKDKEYVENFYISLTKELKETNKEIKEKSPSQKMLVDTLNFYRNNEALSLLEVIKKTEGIKGPSVRLNYWKALSNSKIELIEYEKLSILAELEEGNELLKYKRNKLADFVFSNVTKKGKEEKAVMSLLMMELISTQSDIQKAIQKILDE